MEPTYWHKQSADEPLFAKLLWSRPENRLQAGKLLIIGGNEHILTAPGLAYEAAVKAGIGTARVLLPDVVKKTIGGAFDEGEFVPSTPSGSFSKSALGPILEGVQWADAAIVAGDLGRNSETAILLDSLLMRYGGMLTIAQDAVDYFLKEPRKLLERPNTLIVATIGQLQKMAQNLNPPSLIMQSMSLHAVAGVLNGWTQEKRAAVISEHAEQFLAALDGLISTTPAQRTRDWQAALGAWATVWWLQQPQKAFEAITTAVWHHQNSGD